MVLNVDGRDILVLLPIRGITMCAELIHTVVSFIFNKYRVILNYFFYYFVFELQMCHIISRGPIRLHLKLFTIHSLRICVCHFILLWCVHLWWDNKYTQTTPQYNMKIQDQKIQLPSRHKSPEQI